MSSNQMTSIKFYVAFIGLLVISAFKSYYGWYLANAIIMFLLSVYYEHKKDKRND